MSSKNIVVIGSGAYGTAIANLLLDNNHVVTILGIDEEEINDININKHNNKYFPKKKLINQINATLNYEDVFNENLDVIVIAVPSMFISSVCMKINKFLKSKPIIINTSKGLEPKNLSIPYYIYTDKLKLHSYQFIAGIYGASIASEILDKNESGVVAVSNDIEHSKIVKEIFENDYFNVHVSDQIINIEYSSILKNSYAIFMGIANRVLTSNNTLLYFISSIVFELKKILSVYGGDQNKEFTIPTFADLLLSLTFNTTRNFKLGLDIGQIDNGKKALKNFKLTTEGVQTCKLICEDLIQKKVNAPILATLYEILFDDKKPSVYLKTLFSNLKNQ